HQDEPTEAAQSATPGPVLDVGIGFELIDLDRGQVVHRAVLVLASSNSPRLHRAHSTVSGSEAPEKGRHGTHRQRPERAGHGTENQTEKRCGNGHTATATPSARFCTERYEIWRS